jgi:hypothetical protein
MKSNGPFKNCKLGGLSARVPLRLLFLRAK